MNRSSKTDWGRIGGMTDENIDTSDISPLPDSFFDEATIRDPKQSAPVTIHVDPQILAWFQAQGAEYETLMNAALQSYVKSHSR